MPANYPLHYTGKLKGLHGAGVYAIVHLPSGKQYIGCTRDLQTRYKQHQYWLGPGSLITLYQAEGPDGFAFIILEKISNPTQAHLAEREQYWLDLHFVNTGTHGFNRNARSGYSYSSLEDEET